MKFKVIFVAAMLLTPTAALAAPGVVTASVRLLAGPGSGFPVVDRIPGGSHVNIHGCLRGDAWCDVSWSGDRGWVSSQYLEYLYRNHYVYLPDYVDVIDVPVVPFVLNSYWSSYYAGRPWYHRRAHWNGYWQSHARYATRNPAGRSTRLGGPETHAAVTRERARVGVVPSVPRQQSAANLRGAQADRGRIAHVNGPRRTFSHMPPPVARGPEPRRFSAAPVARPAMPAHVAQPNVGRIGGSPMNARAQMGAPPAMPHMGGGAPHVNAAPRGGGGPAGHPHR
jgi:uncharacterized protein YraI